MVHTGAARPYSACRSGSGLNEGLGRNRGDACLKGRTTLLPECCDAARLRVPAKLFGTGEPRVWALPARDAGEPKDTAHSLNMKAEAGIALSS